MTDSLAPGAAVATSAVHIELEGNSSDSDVPQAGFVPLAVLAGCELGVWEHSVGISDSIEEDEVSVVISGSATIRFEDGVELHIAAGDVFRLSAGMRTTWTVHDTLRKFYVCPDELLQTPISTDKDAS